MQQDGERVKCTKRVKSALLHHQQVSATLCLVTTSVRLTLSKHGPSCRSACGSKVRELPGRVSR